jgi:CBS domain-containing protein
MTLEEVRKFLGKVKPFQKLDRNMLENIAAGVIVEYYPKDTVIFHEESYPCEYLQVINKGRVRISHGTGSTEYRSEGDSFGCLRDRADLKIHAAAVEDTICYLISKEVLFRILETAPSISEYFKPHRADRKKR